MNFPLWFLVVLLFNTAESTFVENEKVVDCKIAVLGAGFAGAYAAYKLSPIYKDALCVIEKLDRDGGRVFDVRAYPGGPVFGVGALRVTETQRTMLDLAKELQIDMQIAKDENELLKVRGQYFYRAITHNDSQSEYMCQQAFRNLTCNYNGLDTDKMMLDKLLDVYRNNPEKASEHPDFPTYILSIFGDEGLAFIRESVRYNSPFTSISTRGILDFFQNELDGMGLDPIRYYPKGGMSQYILKMMATAFANGAGIYRQEPVIQVDSDLTDPTGKFYIKTPGYVFRAESVLSSLDPLAWLNVSGNVAEMVKKSCEFRVISPKTLAIVTAWWDNRWWENSAFHRTINLSRVVSHENCFNTMDIPTFPYGMDQNVTRAVYDDGACVNTWRTLVADESHKDSLAKEVRHSLSQVFHDVTVPMPKYIHGFVHENAWHFQKPESQITNQQIFDWSLQPIANKKISLIGEAYNLNYAAWCDGALKSTMTVLKKFYNFEFKCLFDKGSPAVCPLMKNDSYTQISRRRRVIHRQGSINDLLP